MPKMKLFRVSGYCCAIATTAPTYSLNNACAGPANLSASTSPLDVRSRRSRSTESLTKAQLIFMMFRELRPTRKMKPLNASSPLRVREAPLASLGSYT